MWSLSLPRILLFFGRAGGNEPSRARAVRARAEDAVAHDDANAVPVDPLFAKRAAESAERRIGGFTQEDVLARIRANDVEAFELVYREFFPALWRFAYSLVHTRDAAEELLHDLFLTLWERRVTWHVQGDLGVYLQTAVRNRAYKRTRHDGVVRRLEHAVEQHVVELPAMGRIDTPERELELAELQRAFTDALRTASDRERQIAVLRWSDERTFEEIADILGLSKTRVRVLLARLQARIRPLLERVIELER